MLDLFNALPTEDELDLVASWFKQTPELVELMAQYIYRHPNMILSRVAGYVRVLGDYGINALLDQWFDDRNRSDAIFTLLEKVFSNIKYSYIDTTTLRALYEYLAVGLIVEGNLNTYKILVWERKLDELRELLLRQYDQFCDKYLALIPNDFTSHLLRRAAEDRLNKFYIQTFARLM